jgi:hypothetical protein
VCNTVLYMLVHYTEALCLSIKHHAWLELETPNTRTCKPAASKDEALARNSEQPTTVGR